jgi:ATP synthase protein I
MMMLMTDHPAIKVFLVQGTTMLIGAIIGQTVFSTLHAASVLIGGLVALIPQGLMGFWVFKQQGARNARAIARSFFVGEGLKLSITAVLFALVWSNVTWLNAPAVLAGFVTTVLVGQLSLPLTVKRESKH